MQEAVADSIPGCNYTDVSILGAYDLTERRLLASSVEEQFTSPLVAAPTVALSKIEVNFTIAFTSYLYATSMEAEKMVTVSLKKAINSGSLTNDLRSRAIRNNCPAAKNVTVIQVFINPRTTHAPTAVPTQHPTQGPSPAPPSVIISKSRLAFLALLSILGIVLLAPGTGQTLVLSGCPPVEEMSVAVTAANVPHKNDFWIEFSVSPDFDWGVLADYFDEEVSGSADVDDDCSTSTAITQSSTCLPITTYDTGAEGATTTAAAAATTAPPSVAFKEPVKKPKAMIEKQADGSMMATFYESTIKRLSDGSTIVKFGSHRHAKTLLLESRRKGIATRGQRLYVRWAQPLQWDSVCAFFHCKDALIIDGLPEGFNSDAVKSSLKGAVSVTTLPTRCAAVVRFDAQFKARAVLLSSKTVGLTLLGRPVEARWALVASMDYYMAFFDRRTRLVVAGIPEAVADADVAKLFAGSKRVFRQSHESRVIEFWSPQTANAAYYTIRNPAVQHELQHAEPHLDRPQPTSQDSREAVQSLGMVATAQATVEPAPERGILGLPIDELSVRWAQPWGFEYWITVLHSESAIVVDGLPENFATEKLQKALKGAVSVLKLPDGVSAVVRFSEPFQAKRIVSNAKARDFSLLDSIVEVRFAWRFHFDFIFAQLSRRNSLVVEGLRSAADELAEELPGVVAVQDLPGCAKVVTFSSVEMATASLKALRVKKRREQKKRRLQARLVNMRREQFETGTENMDEARSTISSMQPQLVSPLQVNFTPQVPVFVPEVANSRPYYLDYLVSRFYWANALVVDGLPDNFTAVEIKKIIEDCTDVRKLPDGISAIVVFKTQSQAMTFANTAKEDDLEILGAAVTVRGALRFWLDYFFARSDRRKRIVVEGVPESFSEAALGAAIRGSTVVEKLSDSFSAMVTFSSHRDAKVAVLTADKDALHFMNIRLSARWAWPFFIDRWLVWMDRRSTLVVTDLPPLCSEGRLWSMLGVGVTSVRWFPGGTSTLVTFTSHRRAHEVLIGIRDGDIEYRDVPLDARWALCCSADYYLAEVVYAVQCGWTAIVSFVTCGPLTGDSRRHNATMNAAM